MIVFMAPEASQADIDYVVRRAASLGCSPHVSVQGGTTVIGLAGDLRGLTSDAFAGLRSVTRVQPVTRPFRLASLDFRPERTRVRVGAHEVGGQRLVVIAGPCSVETSAQLLAAAEQVRNAGATMLRGGAFKPRSSPYSFQGLGEAGLQLLAEARQATGLPIVTEVLAPEHVPVVSKYADVLQIGQRNMQNFALLTAVGETRLPVLLKRGMMCTIEELLLSAEYVLARGNEQVMLCERGIRTFETYTRNTLDINAVPLLRELSHLPIIVDPSHATGKASLVRAVSRAAVAAGADGLIVEVHPDPERAWSDGFQSLAPEQFATLMAEVRPVAEAVGRSV
jgi:3-deoxy-7-phosphoheptulonate synthase